MRNQAVFCLPLQRKWAQNQAMKSKGDSGLGQRVVGVAALLGFTSELHYFNQ
jgi:hypothetical protein